MRKVVWATLIVLLFSTIGFTLTACNDEWVRGVTVYGWDFSNCATRGLELSDQEVQVLDTQVLCSASDGSPAATRVVVNVRDSAAFERSVMSLDEYAFSSKGQISEYGVENHAVHIIFKDNAAFAVEKQSGYLNNEKQNVYAVFFCAAIADGADGKDVLLPFPYQDNLLLHNDVLFDREFLQTFFALFSNDVVKIDIAEQTVEVSCVDVSDGARRIGTAVGKAKFSFADGHIDFI